jgi:hypothetical protein
MFRVIGDELFSVASNLSVSNMYFSEFADAADGNGVFGGFHGPSRAELKDKLPSFMLNPSEHRAH